MAKKILIIEDNEDILELMQYLLEEDGFEVFGSIDSKPIKELKSLKPDLIIMDNRLSDGSGVVFCQQIKQQPETRHIPVILISANIGLEELTVISGADGYLAKPFDVDVFMKTIKRFTISN
jgi:CheY-like chemotaxis protein